MTDKSLTVASLNVRGLRGGSSKPKEIKAWLVSLPTPPQVVLLQEHHLGRERIQAFASGIEFWKGGTFWNDGIPMGRSQRISAGTVILVDRATAPLVKAHDILTKGHAQYVTLQSPDNKTLTIITMHRAPLATELCSDAN
jgi:hypothetical protein